MTSQPSTKITYITLSADNEELHAGIETALIELEAKKGSTYPLIIGGERREADDTFPVISPVNTEEHIFYFQNGTEHDTQDAIAAARNAFPAWSRTPWEERVAVVEKVAAWLDEHVFELSAAMMLEMGKNRLEALAEVAETADILRYYIDQMREENGFQYQLESQTGDDINRTVMRPHGVWAVISPFNFPLALAAGPIAAALMAGNTCIAKPSLDAPYTLFRYVEAFYEAGLPEGALSFITGPDTTAAAELVDNPGVDGITFTGSYEVGFNRIYTKFAKDYPKPVIAEMGGKNPVLISPNADLDKAALGVMRGAFGLGGQKCSATSRVYIHADVYDDFREKIIALTRDQVTIGDPTERDTFLGPVSTAEAYERYKNAIETARQDGAVAYGGEVLTEGDLAKGYFVSPAIIEDLPLDHDLNTRELFLPIVTLNRVESMKEAMEEANKLALGLTAGIFSEDEEEITWFFDNIEAGVIYANRSGGATTGAWPTFQTFGGWKGSGSTGPNIFGPYSMVAYMREQSQTIFK